MFADKWYEKIKKEEIFNPVELGFTDKKDFKSFKNYIASVNCAIKTHEISEKYIQKNIDSNLKDIFLERTCRLYREICDFTFYIKNKNVYDDFTNRLDNNSYKWSNVRRFKEYMSSRNSIYNKILELKELNYDNLKITPTRISIETKPIVLEYIEFGRFCIELNSFGNYKVIALEPNCASENPNVTHPHVSDEKLCEGAGKYLITNSLNKSEFSTFFDIIISILNTYNPDSPYVELEHWKGNTCSECGEIINPDDILECEQCESYICSDCVYWCHDCEGYFCSECISTCTSCQNNICNNCIFNCSLCGNNICEDCSVRCVSCGNDCCEDCCITCNDCKDTICNHCVYTCEFCDNTFCEECISKCSECDKHLCSSCINKYLGQILCDECYEEKKDEENEKENEETGTY